VDWANKSRAHQGVNKSAALTAEFIVSMCGYAQGQIADARSRLRNAVAEMEKLSRLGKETLTDPLTDVLVSQVMRHEAEVRVAAEPVATQPSDRIISGNGPQPARRGSAGIAARADGSYRLEVVAGKIVGQTAQVDVDHISHWSEPKDYVTWNLNVRKTGWFIVTLDYSCDGRSAGSTIEIVVGSNKLTRKIPTTNGWFAYQAVRMGAIEIDKTGVVSVQIRPLNKTGDSVMYLRTVLLRPRALATAESVAQ